MQPTRSAPAAVALLAAALAACGGGDDEPQVIGTTVAGAEAIAVVATDFAFEPSTVELAAGEAVNVTLEVDEGGHDLVVADAGFRIPILDEPDAAVATLQIDEPGTYELLCSVPGHAQEGMVGTVVVS